MKTVCIVQARMGSKRLPGKVSLPLNGHTVLAEVLKRCQRIPGVDEVVCATPDQACRGIGFLSGALDGFFPHLEADVLGRYYAAANAQKANFIVRITADCPLISPELCGEVLAALKRNNADYSSNVMPRTFPKGFDCEAFTMDTLRAAHIHAVEPSDREHVTPWMQRANIKRVNVRSPWPMDGRLTLDTWDDYQTIRASFDDADKHLRAA